LAEGQLLRRHEAWILGQYHRLRRPERKEAEQSQGNEGLAQTCQGDPGKWCQSCKRWEASRARVEFAFSSPGYSISTCRGMQTQLRASKTPIWKSPRASSYLGFAEQQPSGRASSLHPRSGWWWDSPGARHCSQKVPKRKARPARWAGWSPGFLLGGSGRHPDSNQAEITTFSKGF